jgi:hypothetical protein
MNAAPPARARRDEEDDSPWLAPIRKAWEPPADGDEEPRSRWGFFRRTG